jgi:hypothetical protein
MNAPHIDIAEINHHPKEEKREDALRNASRRYRHR